MNENDLMYQEKLLEIKKNLNQIRKIHLIVAEETLSERKEERKIL